MKAAIVLCLAASAAHAQPAPTLPAPDTSKVEALFEEGNKHYDVGEYDAAIAAFKQAYALMPDPSFLFNIGQAYRQKKSCRESTAAYKAYLRNAPDEDRAKVEQFIRDLADCTRIEEERAKQLEPPPRLSPRHRKLRIAGIAAGGVGLALLGAGVYYTTKSLGVAHDLELACADECDTETYVELDRKGRDFSRNATILYSVGGSVAAIGSALVLYTVFRAEHVSVAPTPGGAMITTARRF